MYGIFLLNFSHFRSVGIASNLQKALHANNRSSLTNDETPRPFLATCSLVRKNNEKNKMNNLVMVLVLRTHTLASVLQISLKRWAFEVFKLLCLAAGPS